MGQEYLRQVTTQKDINYLSNSIIHDDFEDTLLKWVTQGTGDFIANRDVNFAFRGGASLQLKTQSITPTAGDTAEISRTLPLRSYGALEYSLALHITEDSSLDNISIFHTVYDGALKHRLELIYYPSENVFKYRNAAGSYVTLDPNLIYLSGAYNWQLARFSWNIATNTILAYQCSVYTSDPIALPTQAESSFTAPSNTFSITIMEVGSTLPAEIHVDDILIRQF